jgi:tetratricopeptide (TPR) repeat protein
MFRRALTLLAELPASADRDALELDLRIALGSPLVSLEGYGSRKSHRLYDRTRALCRRLGRPVDPPILRGLGLARLQGCRFADCEELARELHRQGGDDPVARTEGRYLLGVSAFWRGDLASAREHLDDALATYDEMFRDRHLALYAQDPRTICLVRRGLLELWIGEAESARESARLALASAAEIDHPMTRGYALTYAAVLAAECGDFVEVDQLLRDAEEVWRRLSERYLLVLLDALRGLLAAREGAREGAAQIEQSVAASRTDGETLHLTYTLLLLARARGLAGEFDAGRAATREAIAWTQGHDQHYLAAELWRTDGEFAFGAGDHEAAASSLRRAVEIATDQGAHFLALRALHSLACRFPEDVVRQRLGAAVEALPGCRDLPAFRAAAAFLAESD